MAGVDKVKRSQFVTYINSTPNASSEKWELLGIGITEYGIAYNPQITTEKWIIHDNASSSLESNQKQSDVTQKIYKDDTCFQFINSLRDKVGGDVATTVLDIDTWNETEGAYRAKKSNCIIAVTNYMGEDASIEYSLYYNGDATEGTVTISEDGVPTFVADN